MPTPFQAALTSPLTSPLTSHTPPPDNSPAAPPAPVVVHGIANCDQVRATMSWFRQRGIATRLHDVRKDGLSREQIDSWVTRIPWNALINRRGLTWRQLPPAERSAIVDQTTAIEALVAHPLLLRRPVIDHRGTLLVGHSGERLAALFAPPAGDAAPGMRTGEPS